ncbi:dihydrolipoyl dehydrogenase family protein [Fundidesulfovibrio soli]|uniref:dihydrolipoyl dehydrogenase family protein n=1 Tax=Fundidesulfovibrio soli TaxID=2922716 RepID=UPI001FB0483E|nr:NAD(P)/FAD-dependent oxidoreductase [Fundidesulfovibrio soli]
MAKVYDLVVVGSGPGAGPAVKACVKAGWRVAVVEESRFGGVCPNTGCNPKKILMAVPEARGMAAHLLGKGVAGTPECVWNELMAFKRAMTEPISQAVVEHYQKLGVDIFQGRGVFTGPGTVHVEGHDLQANRFLLAVGCGPRELGFPGAGHVSVSDAFLDLEELPERLVFLGGGFIAFEFAHIANACGSRASILTHGDRALRRFDADAADRVVAASRDRGVEVLLNSPVFSVERTGQGLVVRSGADGKTVHEADLVVHCAGRVPQVEGLGLDAANVAFGPKGIIVDEHMQSVSNNAVYAVGDCAATPFALTPTADMESAVAAANMLGTGGVKANYTGIPSVLFTLPPLAMVGLTEEACTAKGLDYDKCELDLAGSFPWKRLGETVGYSKVLTDKTDGKILGAHILGHNAEEIINLFALAMRQGLPVSALHDGIWAYPTCGYYVRYMG